MLSRGGERATADVGTRRHQDDADLCDSQFRFRVHVLYALQRVQEEVAKLAHLGVAVTELARELLPRDGAGPAQIEESVREPGVDVEVHRALAQLADRIGR